jgi:hypothetical protein
MDSISLLVSLALVGWAEGWALWRRYVIAASTYTKHDISTMDFLYSTTVTADLTR